MGMAAAVARLATPTLAHDPEAQDMEITRKAERETVDGPEEYFTGTARITANFSRPDPSRSWSSNPARVPPGIPIRSARR